jgi:quercetin dioxygenase-like cupin family protein
MKANRGRGLLVLLTAVGASASARAAEPSVEVLMDSARTVLQQPFDYPVGEARFQAVLVTVPPGGVLPRHSHPVPVLGYVLEGLLTVTYDGGVTRTYRAGEAIIEAFRTAHRGHNPAAVEARLLAVYATATDVPGTEIAELPAD